MVTYIEKKVTRIEQPNTIEEAFKLAEMAGRVSHRSEDKITDDSYVKFIGNMKKLKHLSVLEFAPMYLLIQKENYIGSVEDHILSKNQYTIVDEIDNEIYISTNYRVLVENSLEYLTKYWVKPVIGFHTLREMFEVIAPISVTREANRHRTLSVLEESTRYVNYSKDKHGSSIKIIDNSESEEVRKISEEFYERANETYMKLIEMGCKAEDARKVLPLNTASKVYYSAFTNHWNHFLSLRNTTSAHHEIRDISKIIESLLLY